MGDIQYWDDTLITELEKIQTVISKISDYPPNSVERQSAITNAKNILEQANQTKLSYKMESRLVIDPKIKNRYKSKLNKHEVYLNKLTLEVQEIAHNDKHNELSPDIETGITTNKSYSNRIISYINGIQDKTQTSLTRTIELIGESKNVGSTSLLELTRQREQIESVNNDMERIEDELTRADRLIKTFAKRIATDKLFQCFSCVNSLLFISLIIYTIIIRFKKKPFGESENTDTV